MKVNLIYIPSLTGVRAIAAYLVFFHHFNPAPESTWLWGILNEGHIGVTIFFVLSGFLIPLRYFEHVKISRHWLKRYFLNRFSRIYPLYFLLTLITFIVIWNSPSFDPISQWQEYTRVDKILVLFLNLTFLRGFFDQFKFTGIAQGWTLTVEECFYFTAPIILVLLARARVKYALLVAAAFSLVALGCLLVNMPYHRFGLFNSYQFIFNYTFFGRAIEFMLGAALALFIRQHPTPRQGIWFTTIGGL